MNDQPLMNNQKSICGAKAKQTGQPCRRIPMANGRCPLHGGKAGRPAETYEFQDPFIDGFDEEEETLLDHMKKEAIARIDSQLNVWTIQMRRNLLEQKRLAVLAENGQTHYIPKLKTVQGIQANKTSDYIEKERELLVDRIERINEAYMRMYDRYMKGIELKHKIELVSGSGDDDGVKRYVEAMIKARAKSHEGLWD